MAKKAKKRVVKKTRRGPVILPKKMSSLIAIALKDIRKAEKLPKQFVVDMNNWFVPENVECKTSQDVVVETHHICTLCAAGSVMAFSLGKANSNAHLCPQDFPKNCNQLRAIDELREGNVSGAALALGLFNYDSSNFNELSRHYHKFWEHIPEYDRSKPEPFHKAMKQLETKLKKAKL